MRGEYAKNYRKEKGREKHMKKFRLYTKLKKPFYSRFDVLGSYTGSGMHYSEPETDADDL